MAHLNLIEWDVAVSGNVFYSCLVLGARSPVTNPFDRAFNFLCARVAPQQLVLHVGSSD